MPHVELVPQRTGSHPEMVAQDSLPGFMTTESSKTGFDERFSLYLSTEEMEKPNTVLL